MSCASHMSVLPARCHLLLLPITLIDFASAVDATSATSSSIPTLRRPKPSAGTSDKPSILKNYKRLSLESPNLAPSGTTTFGAQRRSKSRYRKATIGKMSSMLAVTGSRSRRRRSSTRTVMVRTHGRKASLTLCSGCEDL